MREDGEWVEDKAGHGCVSMEEVVGPQGRGIPSEGQRCVSDIRTLR